MDSQSPHHRIGTLPSAKPSAIHTWTCPMGWQFRHVCCLAKLLKGDTQRRIPARVVARDDWFTLLQLDGSDFQAVPLGTTIPLTQGDRVITMERRSAPIMILSLAASKSSISTNRLLRRAANSAASFTRFAKSAPDIPGVPRAKISAFTSGETGTLRMCTIKICSRPRWFEH